MFCKNCGNPIVQGDLFCQNCGTEVETENTVPTNSPVPSFTGESNNRKYDKGRKATAFIFGVMSVVFILLIGGIGWGGYTLYKLNRDIDGTAPFAIADTNPKAEEKVIKTDFEYLVDISNDTSTGVQIGYNADSILDSLTLVCENGENIIQRKRGKSDFTNVHASSSLAPTSHSSYDPENVLDGDKNTAWVEGAKGLGEGQWIELSADSAHKVYGLCIRNGFTKEEKRLVKNAQAKRIRITFSDGSSNEYELEKTTHPDQECSNVILFTDGPVETKKIRIKILSVYDSEDYIDLDTGERFARDLDMAISDVYVLQWDDE